MSKTDYFFYRETIKSLNDFFLARTQINDWKLFHYNLNCFDFYQQKKY